jgi:hypothetical protein
MTCPPCSCLGAGIEGAAVMTDVILLSAIAGLVALLGLIMLYRTRRGPAAEDQPRPR